MRSIQYESLNEGLDERAPQRRRGNVVAFRKKEERGKRKMRWGLMSRCRRHDTHEKASGSN